MDQNKMNEDITMPVCQEVSEPLDIKSVFSALQQNSLYKYEKPVKKSHKKAGIIAGIVSFASAAIVAFLIFFVVLSPKAKFFGAFEDIIERHLGNTEGYQDAFESLGNFEEQFALDINIDGADIKGGVKLNYNGTAGELIVTEDENEVKVYADKDNIVMTDGKDPAYSLSVPSLEAYVSEQENETLKTYKSLFEVPAKDRLNAADDLIDIINSNLGRGYFENCKMAHDGKEYDAVRFYTAEADTATMLASVLEDIDNCENEHLRSEIAWFLVNTLSVTKGADISATIQNAIDEIVNTTCTVEAIVGFDSGNPILFALEVKFGDNRFKIDYSFIRSGAEADVYFGVLLDNGQMNTALVYEGKRIFESDNFADSGKLSLITSTAEQKVSMSGEMSAMYKNEKLTNLSIALSSEDMNDRFGLTLSLTDNISLSYTSMTQGYGSATVITADRTQGDGKFALKNGKITVNEIASDELLALYQIDASQLGSTNYTFNADITYDEDNAKAAVEFASADEFSITLTADIKGESGFFGSLFKDNILDSDTITLNAEIKVASGDESETVIFTGSLSRTDIPDIVKMEGGESINGTDKILDAQKTKQMVMHFMNTRKDRTLIDWLWEDCVVMTVYDLTGTELIDINSAKVDITVYDKIIPGTSTQTDVEGLFSGAVPLRSESGYQYCSPDYVSDNSAGKIIYVEFQEDKKVLNKIYIDYDLTSKEDDLAGIDTSAVKVGMTKQEMLEIFGKKNPVMLESIVQEGSIYEYYYYGVTDMQQVVVAIELKDGVISRTA